DATHKYETPDMLFRCSLRQLSSCIYVDGAIEAIAFRAAPVSRNVHPRREMHDCIDPLYDLGPTRKAGEIACCDANRASTTRLPSNDAPHLVSAPLQQQ